MSVLNAKFSKGQEVVYLGEYPAVIRSVKETYGDVYYSIKYKKQGVSFGAVIYEKSNTLTAK